MTAPRLSGPRVALVPVPAGVPEAVSAADSDALSAALGDAGLRAGDGWPHEDTADALRPLVEDPGSADRSWLVVVDGAVVGDCGWTSPVDAEGTVEIGYGLAAPARGGGLGTEAVGVLVAWTEAQPGVRAVAASALVGNTASRGLLRRLGFAEAPAEGRWVRAERPTRTAVRGRHVC